MKKIVLLLFVIASGLVSFAQEDNRLVISAGQLKSISLGDNMNVVLISATSSGNELKGMMDVFEKLNVAFHNGSMHVAPGRRFSADEKVYVIVNDLESLTIGQNTKVSTEGFLYSRMLKVYVQDGSLATLRTTGDVKAYSLDNLEFSIRKTPIRLNASR
jgi:hypothetical protein